MTIFAHVEKVNDRHFRIMPISVGLYTIKFRTRAEAAHIAEAVNRAYFKGCDYVRKTIKDALAIEECDERPL